MKRIIREDRSAYEQWIRPDHGLFHQSWWWDAVCGEDHWRALIGRNDEKVEWIWPLSIQRKWGIRYVSPPPITYSSAPLWLENEGDPGWMPVIEAHFSSLAEIIRVKDRNPSSNWPDHWQYENRFRQFINPNRSGERLMNRCSKSKRKQIRRGADRLPSWMSGSLEEVIGHFGRFEASYRPDPRTLKLLSGLNDSPAELICRLQQNASGEVVAGFILILFRDRLYTISSSMHMPESPNYTMAHLMWQIVLLAKQRAASLIDLCGSELKGVRRFHLEMGAEETSYAQRTYCPNPLIRFLMNLRRRLS